MYPSGSANAKVRPNGPSKGGVTIGMPWAAIASWISSAFSALSQSTTPQPSLSTASRSTAGSRRAKGTGLGIEDHRVWRGDGRAGQAEALFVEAGGSLQVAYLQGEERGSNGGHDRRSLASLVSGNLTSS